VLKIMAYQNTAYAGRLGEKQAANKLGTYFAGLKVIVDSLQRNGYDVDWGGCEDVSKYNIILVSITSSKDWLPFLAERVKWGKGIYKVIVGGAGAMNPRPFLPFVDCFVLGRGENLIIDIVKGLEKDVRHVNESVIWSNLYSNDDEYYFRQESLYPHRVFLDDGETHLNKFQRKARVFEEKSMGCPYKCLFCAYSHHRKHIDSTKGDGMFRGAIIHELREMCMLDIIRNKDKIDLGMLRICALDGISERLRFNAGKMISRENFREFLKIILLRNKNMRFKLYNIVGMPTECEDDYFEFIEDVDYVDKNTRSGAHVQIELHNTPFQAMPATPAACWPMSYRNYRGIIANTLMKASASQRLEGKGRCYDGDHFTVCESIYTETLPSTALQAICHRGTEKDSDNIRKLALKWHNYDKLSGEAKLTVLSQGFDLKTIFGEFSAETLPTRNIKTYKDVLTARA